jgi:hypothetical protein
MQRAKIQNITVDQRHAPFAMSPELNLVDRTVTKGRKPTQCLIPIVCGKARINAPKTAIQQVPRNP